MVILNLLLAGFFAIITIRAYILFPLTIPSEKYANKYTGQMVLGTIGMACFMILALITNN